MSEPEADADERARGSEAGGTRRVTVAVSPWFRILAGGSFLVSIGLLVSGELTGLAVGGACVCGMLTVVGLNRWYADARGIERRFPLLKRVRIDWAEVVAVEEEPAYANLVFKRRLGKALEVSSRMRGSIDLCRLVLDHAPARALTEAVRANLERRIRRENGIDMAIPVVTSVESAVMGPGAGHDAASRWRENPFFLLGLSPECSRAEVERAGQKLLALLAIDSGPAKTVVTPLGPMERTPDGVRAAMAELRDPERRLVHELWARLPPSVPEPPVTDESPDAEADPRRPWTDARIAAGGRS